MNEYSPHFDLSGSPASLGHGPASEGAEFQFTPFDPETADGTDPAAAYSVGLGESGENPMIDAGHVDEEMEEITSERAPSATEDLSGDSPEGIGDDETFRRLVRDAFGQAADSQEIAPDLVLPSGGTPPIKPPSDGSSDLGSGELPERPEGDGSEPQPTLEVGEVVEYGLEQSGYSPILSPDSSPGVPGSITERTEQIVGASDEFREYDGETDLTSIEVAPDTTIIARGSSERPITLTAWARDGLVITFQHPATGEGAMVNISSSEAGTEAPLELIQSVLQAATAFSSDGVVVHVFGGNQEALTMDGVTQSRADGVADYLRGIEMLSNVTVAHGVQGEIDITMDVHTGIPEARVGGVVVYYPIEVWEESAVPEVAEATDATTESDGYSLAEDAGRWSYVLYRTDSLIAEPTSPQIFISDLLPAGQRQAKAAETAAGEAIMGYNYQIRRNDAPTAPEDRAALLESHLPDGQIGLDALTYMIQHRSAVLEELGGPEGQTDPQLVVDLLVNRLDSAYSEVDAKIHALATDTREDIVAIRESLIRRRTHFGAKLDQANRLRDRYVRGTE